MGSVSPKPVKRADGKGRTPVEDRTILNGILWVMQTGAPRHSNLRYS
jgi:hypothetical protein